MATNAAQENWLRSAVGRYMNPDGAYGYQCVDVADDYCQAIFGSWQGTIGGGNANQLFRNSAKLWAINYTGSNRPERGDIIIWGGDGMNPYGHIAVVTSSTNSMVSVIQQNYNTGGAANKPASHDNMPYSAAGMGRCVGWLRPRVDGATVPDPGEVLSGDGGGGGGEYSGPPPRAKHERDVKGGSHTSGGSGAVLDGMDWDKLCQLEASGRWDCNTGNGFYGGLQFTRTTWLEFGGGKYADFAHKASREQQIEIGRKVLAGQGVMAWPNTGPKCYNPGAADSPGTSSGGGDGTVAKCYSAPNPKANVTGEYHAGDRVAMDGYVLGERVEFDGGGSSFWYITPKGYSPYRYWEPTETSGLDDKTAYANWGSSIGDYEKLKTNWETQWNGAAAWQDWHDGSYGGGWDTGASGQGVAASYNNGAVFCPPGSDGSGVNPYSYELPTASVALGEVPESLWNYLLSIGWRGRAGDGQERLYPPASTAVISTRSAATGLNYNSAPTYALSLSWKAVFPYEGSSPLNTAALGAWYWLINSAGWRGDPTDGSESIYAPSHPNYSNCVPPQGPTQNYPLYRLLLDDVGEQMYSVLQRAGWRKEGSWLYPP